MDHYFRDPSMFVPTDIILIILLTFSGNVWIYRTYGEWQDDSKDAPDYCNATLYWYAFWITTVTYIIMGTTCFCICCAGIVTAMVSGDGNK